MRGRFCTQPFLVEIKKGGLPPVASTEVFLLLRWVSRSPPHPPQCTHWGTFPPRGRLWGWEEPFPSEKPPPPARPAGGRAVTSEGKMGRRPGKKRRRPPTGSPQPEKVGPGRKNLFLPGVLSSGFLPKKAGPPPGAGRETTSQVLTCAGPNGTTYRRQRTPAFPAGLYPGSSGSRRLAAEIKE